MRARLLVVLALGIAALPSPSHAEKVKTNQETRLYARPGEAAKVLIEIKEGKSMTVLAKQGRWIKVRVNGRTGYVPRSKVEGGEDDMPRNTRRTGFSAGRGTRRGSGVGDAPDDRVGADALGEGQEDEGDEGGGDEGGGGGDEGGGDEGGGDEGGGDEGGGEEEGERKTARVSSRTKVYTEADADSEVAFLAKSDMVLFPGEREGKYTFVENEEGDPGYVLTSALEIEETEEGEDGEALPMGRQIDVRARLGVSFLSQTIKTASLDPGFPNNYGISTAAARISLGGAYMKPYGKQYVIGGELGYDLMRSTPGIKYMNTTTALTLHNLNLRAMVGYDLKKKSGAMLFGRLGFNYYSVQVADVGDLTKNTAKIPSEVVYAPTLGVAFAMPAFSPTIGLRFSLDAIIAGSNVSQTVRLEDGASPSMKQAVLGAGMTYRWKPDMSIQATYDLNYSSYSFGAQVPMSERAHGTATSSARTDVMHSVAVGIAKVF